MFLAVAAASVASVASAASGRPWSFNLANEYTRCGMLTLPGFRLVDQHALSATGFSRRHDAAAAAFGRAVSLLGRLASAKAHAAAALVAGRMVSVRPPRKWPVEHDSYVAPVRPPDTR